MTDEKTTEVVAKRVRGPRKTVAEKFAALHEQARAEIARAERRVETAAKALDDAKAELARLKA